MDFGALKTRIRAYLIDVPAATEAEIGTWINSSLQRLQDRHNFRFMEAVAEVNTVAATRKLADLPSDWKEHRALPWTETVDGVTTEIAWGASRSETVRLFGESVTLDTGAPKVILETPTELHVYPYPDGLSTHGDGEYRLRVPYWSFLSALVNAGDSNWITDKAADYVTYGATAEGMIFNREEDRAAVYVTKAEEEFQRLVRRDKRSRIDNRFTLGFYAGVRGTRFQPRGE